MNAARLAEQVARESYGRLLAQLAARTRDVAAAEDALSEAFAAALKSWPHAGAPDNPEAWLFAAARRKLIDMARRAQTARAGEAELVRAAEELEAEMAERAPPDRRLALLFACAHPAIDASAHTPLMLQTVLGLSAARIAAAFMIEPAAMSQRLVRAKKQIAAARAPFDIPPPEEWPARLGAVLEAIYAAYGEAWSDARGEDAQRRALAEEALWLARIAAAQTDDREAAALVALILMLEARRGARRDGEGRYVPLDSQDVRLWRRDQIEEAVRIMARLAPYTDDQGRFQIEAGIQHAHVARYFSLPVQWAVIERLYAQLGALAPSAAVRLNGIAAQARHAPAEDALAALNALIAGEPVLRSYQPYWALRADLLARLGRNAEARSAYDEAIARARDSAVRRFLLERKAAL